MITTSFGEHQIFDAHTHFFSKSFYEGLGKLAGFEADPAGEVARKLGWDLAPDNPEEVAERWLEFMDKHGVDRMVSIHTLPGDLDSAGRGIQSSEGRLVGYVMVNPDLENALLMLERAVEEYGFRGLALFPGMFHFSVDSDEVKPLLQFANEHSLNVFVHCGVIKVGFRTKLGLPSPFDGTRCNPMALQKSAAEHPNATFIIPHLGSGYFSELLMLADMSPNVYADTSGIGGWAKYLEGKPGKHEVIRQAVDVMGAERLLFGTDSTFFPRGWRRDIFDEQIEVFQKAGLSGEEVGKILGGNLERLVS